MKPLAVIALALALGGCVGSGSGSKWYAPATWFSGAPAVAADKANAKQDAAREAAVKAAQRATHETAEALASAPASRPVEVATEANATAVSLLDQATGPLSTGDLAAIRAQISGLLSDNAKLRAEAEKSREKSRETDADISKRLADANAAVEKSAAALRQAFDRENALANELRSAVALRWILAGVAVIAGAAYLYLRYAVGGLPVAAGKFMRDLRSSHPEAAAIAAPIFDSYLNRNEQAAIARHAT